MTHTKLSHEEETHENSVSAVYDFCRNIILCATISADKVSQNLTYHVFGQHGSCSCISGVYVRRICPHYSSCACILDYCFWGRIILCLYLELMYLGHASSGFFVSVFILCASWAKPWADAIFLGMFCLDMIVFGVCLGHNCLRHDRLWYSS